MDSIKEIKEIKEGLKSLLDRLEKLDNANCTPCEPSKKPFKVKLPKNSCILYHIQHWDGEVYNIYYDKDDNEMEHAYLSGMFFKTREEAEQYLKERKLLFKLHQWAKEKNNGWEPDWSDIYQAKYYIFYDYYRKELHFSFKNSTSTIDKLPYFKSQKIAQACIDEFGEEIKEVLC